MADEWKFPHGERMEKMTAPRRGAHRWLVCVMGCLAGFGLSLILHLHEKGEPAGRQEVAKWESNWPRLKLGMVKEEVLALVGAPNCTTVTDSQVTSSNPPNPTLERSMQQMFDQKMNYAIWSYYGPLMIHVTPGQNVDTSFGQLTPRMIISGDGRLKGHAIKFNEAGRIVEISPD
jgi:hypothetical protein